MDYYPSENADEVFAKMKEQGLDRIIWLNDKDYELLAQNFAQIRAKPPKKQIHC